MLLYPTDWLVLAYDDTMATGKPTLTTSSASAKKAAAGGSKKKTGKTETLIASNKKAFHNYFVEERFVAGIALLGSEVKSLRAHAVTLTEAYARVEKGQVVLHGMHVRPYEQASVFNHEPTRPRPLLLNRREIRKIAAAIAQEGYSLVPLKLFFSRCWVKVELGLCKGKKNYDKRETLAKKDHQRDIERAIKRG
ncbi:MAG: SsrA-binding protein SmpB [Vampirovibrionales bacterium]